MSLTPERWEEVLRLYEAAGALDAAEREDYLARECADPELLAEVRKMLAAATAKEFLEPPPLEDPSAGRDLGDFTLLEEIGRGGMGVVYRALQRPLKRIVAVKVLPASFALTQRQIDRFLREARSTARLSHPNLVTVLTVGDERGVRFFAMEYIDGHNLADELQRQRADLGADEHDHAHLPSSHAADYFRSIAECARQAADGLSYAHKHGVIHRDVKPSNLLLDSAGHIKLVDFGLARDDELGSLSASGDVLGTPHYMSPEQARAHRHLIDHRTDVYSLGVVLYELLTLQRPFEGKTSQQVIDSLLHREPVSIRKLNPRVPRDLETICLTAMAKEPDNRYPDAAAFGDDLQRFLSHEAIRARPPSPLQLALRSARRHRTVLALLGVAFLAACGAYYVTSGLGERRRVARLLQEIVAAREEAPLRELPLSRQLEVRRVVEELRALPGPLVGERYEPVLAAERELAALRDELEQRGREGLLLSRDTSKPEGERELLRLSGLQTLLYATHLFPQDAELAALSSVESAFPTIAVRAQDHEGHPIAAEVYLREVNVLTSTVGKKRALGLTPLPPTPVLPGYYRVAVVFAAGGFRELICNPGPAEMEILLTASRREDEDQISRGMIAFAAGSYTFPSFRCEQPFSEKTVFMDGYLMDPTEVSNREYHEFLLSTAHPRPRTWPAEADAGNFLAAHGDLPVVAITWKDAVAFAEWRGKRLPTAAEWHRAAGGLEGRPLPYSADPRAPLRGNVLALAAPEVPGYADDWAEYLTNAVPVTSHPEARTPEGLHHMFGNVYEYTESMVATRSGPGALFLIRSHDRWLYGGAWDASTLDEGMRTPYYQGTGPNDYAHFIGFRCATSSDP